MVTTVKAFWLCALAILFVSPDSLLVRLSTLNASVGSFWRSFGIFFGLSTFIFLWRRHYTVKFTPSTVLIALSVAFGQICFVYSIHLTSVANVLVLLAGLPMVFSIFLSRILLKEKTPLQTVFAMVFCLFGVTILTRQHLQLTEIQGILFVVLNSLFLSVSFTLTRKNSHMDILPAYMLGSLFASIVAMIISGGDVFVGGGFDQYMYPILNGLVFQTGFYICASIGGKHTPSPVFSFLFLLETLVGIGLAAIVLGEIPTQRTFIGGILILSALIAHSIWHIKSLKHKIFKEVGNRG